MRSLPLLTSAVLLVLCDHAPAQNTAEKQPVLLYTFAFRAPGEERLGPHDNYSEVMSRLDEHFRVRVCGAPLSDELLHDVDLVMIANPNRLPHNGGPPPRHVNEDDVRLLTRFVQNGGGLIFLSNQSAPAYNIEKHHANRLLRQFGIEVTHLEVGAKRYAIPEQTPLIGGLRWAHYIGAVLNVDRTHVARPQVLVEDDLDQPALLGARGVRSAPLLAIAEPGEGRVVVVSDAGWIRDDLLLESHPQAIRGQDNWEIFLRLAQWAGSLPEVSEGGASDGESALW